MNQPPDPRQPGPGSGPDREADPDAARSASPQPDAPANPDAPAPHADDLATDPAADSAPDPAADPAPENWFDRHGWKLMLLIIGFVGLSALGCCGGIGYLVWQLFRSSAVYELSMDAAIEDPRVAEALGEPIDAKWFMQGVIKVDNERGRAALRIPVRGADRDADVLTQALRRNGQWRLRYLAVDLGPDEPAIVVIDRRHEPVDGEPPPPPPRPPATPPPSPPPSP